MPEPDDRVGDRDQPRLLGRLPGGQGQRRLGARQHGHVALPGRGQGQRPPGHLRQVPHAPGEDPRDAAVRPAGGSGDVLPQGQGIAGRPAQDLQAGRAGGRADLVEESFRVPDAERPDRDLPQQVGELDRHAFGPSGEQRHHRRLPPGQHRGQRQQQVQAGRVHPVHVVDHQHQRQLAGRRRAQGADRGPKREQVHPWLGAGESGVEGPALTGR